MNPWDLSASELMIWGLVLHLIADWLLQNDWMASNKMKLKHPAACVHSGIHGILLAIIFGWMAIPLMLIHAVIDTRLPVVWWANLIRQTSSTIFVVSNPNKPGTKVSLIDLGTMVRIWVDQVFHIVCIAAMALWVSLIG